MATERPLPPIRRTSAAAQAGAMIREMILSGRLRPGDRLPPERELSEALRISRPTVRESIRSLVAMNILESRHGSGTFVTSLDIRTLLEPLSFVLALASPSVDGLLEARLLLEPRLAALAAERATPAELAAIERCAAEAPARPGNPDRVRELDARLHRLVAAAGHNDLLVALLDALVSLDARPGGPGAAPPPRAMLDHRDLVEAITGRDPDRACAAMAAHLQATAESR